MADKLQSDAAAKSDAENSDDDGVDDESYSAALAELEDILDHLEDESLDVDTLAQKVERASALIRFCRGRIASARTQVETIVADLDQLADAEGPTT